MFSCYTYVYSTGKWQGELFSGVKKENIISSQWNICFIATYASYPWDLVLHMIRCFHQIWKHVIKFIRAKQINMEIFNSNFELNQYLVLHIHIILWLIATKFKVVRIGAAKFQVLINSAKENQICLPYPTAHAKIAQYDHLTFILLQIIMQY